MVPKLSTRTGLIYTYTRDPAPATDLAKLWINQDKHAEAHNVLAPIYGRFSEGSNTRDLREAKALLAQLR